MAASSRAEVLRLYRALLRESQRFGGYNYRLHDILRCQKTDSLLSYDIPIFSILVRLVDQIMESQVTIGQLYSTQKLVIESPGNT
ncbi:LYR motif-containing protein 4 isoform X2 [Haliaeetus albicilla]|uniref:LYR motif-containing protein 4 isoform X6 n=1 Tax=Haliaeetus leucocephalus TaxID=52644 RepID=UPI00053CE3A0|nr:PREDICTED: LYR motif-containing protein 4 isoform X6 [Haliaeetus leucocephalus]